MERKKGIEILLEKHNRIVNYMNESPRYGMNPRLREADEEQDPNELDFDMNQEEDPTGNPEAMDDLGGGDQEQDFGGDDLGGDMGNELGGLDDMGDDGSFEDNLLPGEMDGQEEQPDMSMDMGADDLGGGEPEEEIDITDFIQKSEDLTTKVDAQVTGLSKQLQDLTTKIQSMDSILAKIEKVEDEIHAMKPQKPIETLKLRSLDSYPYNQGIDDYWKRKEVEIEKLRDFNISDDADKYVLTPQDVENYSDVEIKKSFSPGYEQQTKFDRYQSGERNMGRFHGVQ